MPTVIAEAPHARAIERALIALCAAFLFAKAVLVARININWDEFLYLSHTYELVRGDLHQPLQTIYTRLFSWLTWIGGNEISQIVIARSVMVVLLAITAILIWRLAARWTPPHIALFAPLCYLAASPILRHGASFRADSLLAPVTLGVLLLLTARPSRTRHDCLAGICFGLGSVISMKAILLAPVVLAILLLDRADASAISHHLMNRVLPRAMRFALCASGTAAMLLLLHQLNLPAGPTRAPHAYASDALSKTLLETEFVPRLSSLLATLDADWLIWLLIVGGGGAAIVQRRFLALACSLSLLPILFYRNAFPYYYVVMLAPACVLASVCLEALHGQLNGARQMRAANWITLAIASALPAMGALHLFYLRHDDQARQRPVLDAVHQVFTEPVPYIDHSGMVSSFLKVNPFMSSWGVESYLAKGESFMQPAISQHRALLLVANRSPLIAGAWGYDRLLPIDRQLIERYYVPYWGPILVAGAHATIPAHTTAELRLPFPGEFRLEAPRDVVLIGVPTHSNRSVTAIDENLTVKVQNNSALAVEARLVTARANPPPPEPPPFRTFYLPL